MKLIAYILFEFRRRRTGVFNGLTDISAYIGSMLKGLA